MPIQEATSNRSSDINFIPSSSKCCQRNVVCEYTCCSKISCTHLLSFVMCYIWKTRDPCFNPSVLSLCHFCHLKNKVSLDPEGLDLQLFLDSKILIKHLQGFCTLSEKEGEEIERSRKIEKERQGFWTRLPGGTPILESFNRNVPIGL